MNQGENERERERENEREREAAGAGEREKQEQGIEQQLHTLGPAFTWADAAAITARTSR